MSNTIDMNNGFANFKGVMMCSRPQDKANKVIERPFCSRVMPDYDLGVTPNKPKPRKKRRGRVLQALKNHKRWLANFKNEIQNAKRVEADALINEEIRRARIKKQAEEMRKKIRDKGEQPNPVYDPDTDPEHQEHQKAKDQAVAEAEAKHHLPGTKKTGKMKKKGVPAWAMTKEQNEELEGNEEDNLLEFMENLNYDEYINDIEFKSMVQTLKKRVSELKGEANWREKWKKRLKEKTEKRKKEYLEQKEKNRPQQPGGGGDDDLITMVGGGSLLSEGGRTVSSQRTQESIQSIKDQMKKRAEGNSDWNKSVSGKSNKSELEDKLAKHLADEILRTNMAISKIHSNQSIRKIMEAELKKQLKNQKTEPADEFEMLPDPEEF